MSKEIVRLSIQSSRQFSFRSDDNLFHFQYKKACILWKGAMEPLIGQTFYAKECNTLNET